MAIIDQGNCDNTATAALKYGIFNVYWDRASELGSGFYDRNSDIHIQQPQSPPYSLDYSLDTNAARICLPYTAAHSHSLPKFYGQVTTSVSWVHTWYIKLVFF